MWLKEASRGERQRITIARAMLKNAPVIILDEASASMDVENYACFQEVLSNLIKDKTVATIAHGLSSTADLDKIVIFDQGQIVEKGNLSNLMEKEGLSKSLGSNKQKRCCKHVRKAKAYLVRDKRFLI